MHFRLATHGAVISIHALHEESAHKLACAVLIPAVISIHALHEESAAAVSTRRSSPSYFNPRSP